MTAVIFCVCLYVNVLQYSTFLQLTFVNIIISKILCCLEKTKFPEEFPSVCVKLANRNYLFCDPQEVNTSEKCDFFNAGM